LGGTWTGPCCRRAWRRQPPEARTVTAVPCHPNKQKPIAAAFQARQQRIDLHVEPHGPRLRAQSLWAARQALPGHWRYKGHWSGGCGGVLPTGSGGASCGRVITCIERWLHRRTAHWAPCRRAGGVLFAECRGRGRMHQRVAIQGVGRARLRGRRQQTRGVSKAGGPGPCRGCSSSSCCCCGASLAGPGQPHGGGSPAGQALAWRARACPRMPALTHAPPATCRSNKSSAAA
jgi:hypothetical protein